MNCFFEYIGYFLLLITLWLWSCSPVIAQVPPKITHELKIDFPQKKILAASNSIIVNDIKIKNFSNDTVNFIPQIIVPKHWTLIYLPTDSIFRLPPKSVIPINFKVFYPKIVSYTKEYIIYLKIKDVKNKATLAKRLIPVKIVRHPHAPKQKTREAKSGQKSTKIKTETTASEIVGLIPKKKLWDDDGSPIPVSFKIDTVESKRIVARFKNKKNNEHPNSVIYNSLDIKNLSNKAISIEVAFSKPREWTLIPEKPLNKVIRGGEKYSLSFRTFIPNKQVSGDDYVIIAKIFSSKELLLKVVYNYITVTPQRIYRIYKTSHQPALKEKM